MSAANAWRLDEDPLASALARWKRVCRHRDQHHVDEFLMDLVVDPYQCGQEDGDSGVWTGVAGAPGRRIVVVYVPQPDSRRIAVADINYG